MAFRLVAIFVSFLLPIQTVQSQSLSSEASPAEQKKARAEREKKALALVDEITKELQSIQLPENRIRLSLELAKAVWSQDEKRARALFKEAVTSLNEIVSAIANEDPEYQHQDQLIDQLRHELVQLAGAHDPRLAIDFLRATRPDLKSSPPNSGVTNLEAQLEMRVAIQLANRDPNEALAVAENSLKIALDYEALNLLSTLYSKQKAAAEKLLDGILNAIRTNGIGNSSATPIAMNLLLMWIENNRATRDPAAHRTTANLSLSNLNEQTARELSNFIIDAVLGDLPARPVRAFVGGENRASFSVYPGMTQGMLQQFKPLLGDLERLVPERVSALRSKMVEFDKTHEAQLGPLAKYQELTQNGTAEALMEAAKTAPPEFAESLMQQASWKAINQGDDEQAGRIVEKISDPSQRAEMKKQLARQAFSRASEQKKIAEARTVLARLPVQEQSVLLVQLAMSSMSNGDKPAALLLLTEAQSLLGGRAQNYGHLQAQIQIAKAYLELDKNKSRAIVELTIDRINELVAAALVLNGFDIYGYFRNGEFVIANGNPLNSLAQECGSVLAANAKSDFDESRSVADRFQLRELRLSALTQIVQGAMTNDPNIQ